jgi:hypothetical protein
MDQKSLLSSKLLIATNQLKCLCDQIKIIEDDTQLTANLKLSQLKNIWTDIKKVGTLIDNLKNDLKLLNGRALN